MIVSFENILTPDELAAMRRQLLAAEWARGISAGPQARQVKKNLQIPEQSAVLRELRTLVMRALNRSPDVMSALLPFKIIPPNFNRYTVEDSHYGKHIDSTLRPLPDGSYLRTDVSATLFLSDPEEYDGGELKIIDTFGEQTVKLAAGSLVRSAELGLLGSLGLAEVVVRRRPRVAFAATGDELVPVGQALGPGQIHDSNSHTLYAMLVRLGVEPVDLGILRDDPAVIEAALARAAGQPCPIVPDRAHSRPRRLQPGHGIGNDPAWQAMLAPRCPAMQ